MARKQILSLLLNLFVLTTAFGDADVDFSIQLPKEQISTNEVFDVVATLSWKGGPTDWVVKSIEGPSLTGLREIAHSLSSRTELDGDGSRSLQIHKFSFVADKEGKASIGPIELTLVAQGGQERTLASKTMTIDARATFFNSIKGSPRKMATIAAVVFLALFLFGFAHYRKKRLALQSLREESAREAQQEAEQRLAGPLNEMKELLGDEDCKKLYGRAKDLMVLLLEARGLELTSKEDESILTALSNAQLTKVQQKGLEKVIEDAHLVRFAGLRPDRTEREQVFSRIADFAKPFLHRDDDVD